MALANWPLVVTSSGPALDPEQAIWEGPARLAAWLRQGRLSPDSLLTACLARIERLDPQLRAFALVLEGPARAQAQESAERLRRGQARALEGVPLAVKDNRLLAGAPVGQGSRALPAVAVAIDSEVVARLRRAGAVLVGKTTLPEFAAVPVTESAGWGQTRNPWALDRTPGGSSGGSAAAVAAALVPAAEGNDGGGSLRIPGSCCGLFALKPTRGRISLGPLQGDGLAGLSVDGFLTRRVADTALLLDVVAGPALGDPSPLSAPRVGFSAAAGLPGPRLRLGWTNTPPIAVPVSPVCVEAVAATVQLCHELGHQVDEVEHPWSGEGLAEDFRIIWAVGIRQAVLEVEAAGGDTQLLEPHNRALAAVGAQIEGAQYLASLNRLQGFARSLAPLWERYDLLLTPTLAQPPLRLGELFASGDEDPLSTFDRCDRFSPFTPLANVAGLPAAQLPLHWEAGLPVGVQFTARHAEEAVLLRLAQELERASAWPDRRPPLS
ncbi:MAG: amidase [Candidatus Dormibacteria bacterium]